MDECTLFAPVNGGLGAFLSCGAVSTRVALPSPTLGSLWAINNTGTDYVFLAFGDSSVTATTSYAAFPPGLTYWGIPYAGGNSAPGYMAGITTGPTIAVQISVGNRVKL